MTTITFRTLFVVLLLCVLHSCSKDDKEDEIKNPDACVIDNVDIAIPGQGVSTELDFNYNTELYITSVDVRSADGENVDMAAIDFHYENSKLKEIYVNSPDEGNHRELYIYEDDKLVRIDVYEDDMFMQKQYLSLIPENIHIDRFGSNYELPYSYYILFEYEGDKVYEISYYYVSEEEDPAIEMKLQWTGNNISRVDYLEGSENYYAEFTYDNNRNPYRGLMVNPYFTPYFTLPYILFIDPIGVISFFNENNITSIESPDLNFDIDMRYNSGLITRVEMYDELLESNVVVNIDYQCD